MKTSFVSLLVCSLAVLPLAAEEKKPGDKPAPKPGERPGPPREGGKGPGKGDGSFFREMDKDGDQAISKEEAGERWERMGQLDKDNDGKVTMQEMMAGRPGGDRPGGPDGPEGPGRPGGKGKGGPEMFQRADKNGDGKLTEDEVPQMWSRLSQLDKDKDGAVSQEEARAGRPPGGPEGPGGPGRPDSADAKARGEEMWKRADKNGDGKISQDEVPAEAWERMGRLDQNKDGAVTREEMAAGFAAMRGKGGEPGKGRPGEAGRYGDRGGMGGPEAMFGRYDENKDGKLGSGEVPAEMWDRLRRADTDADGLVSKEELGKVYQEREKSGEGPDAPKPAEKKRPALEDPAA